MEWNGMTEGCMLWKTYFLSPRAYYCNECQSRDKGSSELVLWCGGAWQKHLSITDRQTVRQTEPNLFFFLVLYKVCKSI